MDKLKNEIEKIIVLLKDRNNGAFQFFENILVEINEGKTEDAFQKILSGYAIVQYADFNATEEKLFDEIWKLTKALNG